MTSCPAATALSDADYQRMGGQVLASIEAAADRWLQDDVIDIDTQRTGGLLELVFPHDSRIVDQPAATAAGDLAGRTRRRLPLPPCAGPLARHPRRQRVLRRAVATGQRPRRCRTAFHTELMC